MSTVEVRERLPRDLALPLGAAATFIAAGGVARHGLGWDARAYFDAWTGGMYEVSPGYPGAYNYSPVFAQALYPLAQLPWPVFCAGFVGAAALGVTWLLRPLHRSVAVPLWFACTPEILSGNVYWLLAIATVVGLRHPAAWALPALTKVLPTMGPIWFLARGESRRFLAFTFTVAGFVTLSYAATPDLWRQWFDFLSAHAGDTGPASLAFVPPLWLRVPLALALVVWGARTNRAWVLAPASLLATPVIGAGSFALLAALPRLRETIHGAGPEPVQ